MSLSKKEENGVDISIDTESASPHNLLETVEGQPSSSHAEVANEIFNVLVSNETVAKVSASKARVRLCGFIEQCCKSKSPEVRAWAFSGDLYLRLFDLYLEWNESEAERSLRLVLDLLVDLIVQNRDGEGSVRLKVLDTLVSIMARQSTRPLAKSAIMVLERFLTKSVVSLEEIGSSYKMLKELNILVADLQLWKQYLAEVFNWMKIQFVCPVAGKFVATVYKALRVESERGFLLASHGGLTIELWHEWLLEFLTAEPLLLDGIKNYVFLPLFKSEKKDSVEFLTGMNRLDNTITSPAAYLDTPATLRLASLEVGKRVGLVEEPMYGQNGPKKNQTGPVVLQEELLEHVLIHPSFNVRTLALSLIVSSSSTTRPYSPTALVLIQRHLSMYFTDSEARFRNEFLAKLRDMYKRVRGGIFVLTRSLARAKAAGENKGGEAAEQRKPALYHTNIISHPESELSAALKLHEDFLHWYLGFIKSELVPTASYQRHVTALKTLFKLLQLETTPAKTWETKNDAALFFDYFDETWSRALLDLLIDPFDDVRDMAASILKFLLSDGRYTKILQPGITAKDTLTKVVGTATTLANQTGRADHANGVARASELLHRFSGDESAKLVFVSSLIGALKERISFAEQSLGSAVLEAPTHGLFSALSYIVQSTNETTHDPPVLDKLDLLYSDMISCCQRIWDVVRDVLCDDSPEGHLPDELDEMEGLDTKNLLSYSFRAIDESSKLMKAIILCAKSYGGKGHLHPSARVFSAIGGLSFTQLSTLRHRGALTTVSQTYAICCQMSRFYPTETGTEPLLRTWYKGTLACMFSQRSTTRRSAGIPSMVIGILSANFEMTLEEVMEKLMDIGSTPAAVSETDGSNLPQVHALNSLTGIYKTSYLVHFEKKLEKYLPLCLQLAANCLKSPIWAIRNCGLLLLRGLMDNLFGTSESKATMEAGWDGKANRLHYGRYPSLAPVLLGLLKSGREMIREITTTEAAEAVFPSLDIVRRAGPPAEQRTELQEYIAEYLASPAWHVREIAARTLCSCFLHEGWLASLRSILVVDGSAGLGGERNRFHGALLTGKFLVERLSEVMEAQLTGGFISLVSLLRELRASWPQGLERCPDLYDAYVEVLNKACKYGLHLVRQGDESAGPLLESLLMTPAEMEEMAEAGCQGALLRLQLAVHSVYGLYKVENTDAFLSKTRDMTNTRVSTLIATLEALPQIWPAGSFPEEVLGSLFGLYFDVCLRSTGYEPRAIALRNMTDLLVHCQGTRTLGVDAASLEGLWHELQCGALNPSLSDEIVRASGAILAHLMTTRASGEWDSVAALRQFGSLIAEASTDDKPFDTRYAAAEALKFAAQGIPSAQPDDEARLPFLQALYSILNDDEDEIRNLGAQVLSTGPSAAPVIPMQAAHNLLSSWRGSSSAELSAIAACRMVGHVHPATCALEEVSRWTPSTEQLREVRKFEAALFVVEEHNLFVDEVRETLRWKEVFKNLSSPDEAAARALADWAAPGLKALVGIVEAEGDGPLGWTARPAVFAVCSRVILCAVTLVEMGRCPELKEDLCKLREVGRASCFSGLLLEMTKVNM